MKQNLTFNQDLATLTETQFKLILNSGVRSSKIFNIEFESLILLSYGFVKIELVELLKSGDFSKIIQLALKEKGKEVTIEEVDNYSHNDLLSFILWLKDELDSIARLEREYLSSPPDADMINAGVKELDELGEFNVIDGLVIQWQGAYTHDEVSKMPYHFIFDKLRKTTLETKISKNLNKIQQSKIKKHK